MLGSFAIASAQIAAPPAVVAAAVPMVGYLPAFDWAENKRQKREAREREQAKREAAKQEAPAAPKPAEPPAKPPKALAELARPRKAKPEPAEPIAQPTAQRATQPAAPGIAVQPAEPVMAAEFGFMQPPAYDPRLDDAALMAMASLLLMRKH